MHARVQRYVLSAAVVLVMLLVGKVAEAQNLRVIPVPWVATKPALPHYAYNGHATTLKAIARGGNGSYTVSWDPEGDGTFMASFVTANRYDLGQVFTYPNVAVTTTYQARIRVTSNAQTVDAIYPVRIFPAVPATPCVVVPSTGCPAGTPTTADANLQIMRNVAIDDALWYLHKQMNGQRSGNEESLTIGSQASGSVANNLPMSAGYLWSLGLNGHYAAYNSSYVGTLPDAAANTQRFDQDPFAEDAARLINHLLINAQVVAIPTADESNAVGFPEVNLPPIAGTDDLKAIVWNNDDTYYMGHILSGLSKANLSGYVAQVGNAADILGRRMEYVLQQVVDGLAYSQIDSNLGNNEGSWHYTFSPSNDDLSTTLWAVTGLWHADEFGDPAIIINNRVKGRLAQYISVNTRANPANATQRCGAYETENAGCSYVITAAHMLSLGWIGANTMGAADATVAFPGYSTATRANLRAAYDGTLAFISGNFYGTVSGGIGWNLGITPDGNFARSDRIINHYGMLHWQDAARAVVPNIETFGTANWYRHFTDYLMRNQESDGRWQVNSNGTIQNISDGSGGVNLTTVWGLLVLQPDAIPPLAIAKATPTNTAEGSPIFFDGSESDPGSAVFTGYTWDFGNGDTRTGESVSYAFPDNGTYNVTLTLASVGGSTTATIPVTITNAPPAPVAGPSGLVTEGSSVPFFAFPNDPGTRGPPPDVAPGDTHTYAWTFGDGGTGIGQNPTHVYADEGNFQVRVTVTDDDGASAISNSFVVVVTNVAPTITSQPTLQAFQNTPYSYPITFTDPGTLDTGTCTVPVARPGMVMAGCTLNWAAPQLGAGGPVRVCVTDNDGGQACQNYTITVDFIDTDNDGLPDVWENANFGDLTHGQTGDEDGDGIGNIDEYNGGTNPNSYDGPTAPVATAPVCGSTIADQTPNLTVSNATDPQATALRYDFQVFSDPGLTMLVASVNNQVSGVGSTTFAITSNLNDNAMYWWRARAHDQWTAGPWSAVCSFLVNAVNDAPTAPELYAPAVGATTATNQPGLVVTNATDLDLDDLTYSFELYSDAALTVLVSGALNLPSGTTRTSWTVDVALTDGAVYFWRVRATDENGLAGPYSATGQFTVGFADTDNDGLPDTWEQDHFGNLDQGATGDPDEDGIGNIDEFTGGTDPNTYDGPTAPVATAPVCGSELTDLQPDLVVTNATDPQATALRYDFQLFSDAGLTVMVASASNQAQGVGSTTFSVGSDLSDNARYWWRARARDQWTAGPWSTVCSFLVNSENDAPGAPALYSPAVGATTSSIQPDLVVTNAVDLDLDVLTYTFELYSDAALTVLVTSATDVPSGTTLTAWPVDVPLQEGVIYFWRVMATDEDDLDGPFSETGRFTIGFADSDNDGLPDVWEDDYFGNLDQGATGDPDGDGIGNIDEYTGGTDPTESDAPYALVPINPVCGSEIDVVDPLLVAGLTGDPQGTELTYEFQLFSDAAMTQLVIEDANVDDFVDETVVFQMPSLDENTHYYWRARAADQWTSGPWATCDFVVNAEDEAPGAPGINSPAIGSWINDLTPDLVVDNAVDPDGDALEYEFEVYSDAAMTTLVASQTGVPGDVGTTPWTVDVTLMEDGVYYWRARATDEDSLTGPWSETGVFTVNTENTPPEAPVIMAPQNATVVNVLRPSLIILNPDDADFDVLVYDWELATDDTFSDVIDSGEDVAQVGPANTAFILADDLEEDVRYCWRVRADDGQSTSSYSSACFLVSLLNDPPSVPTLMNPGDDTVARTLSPTFSWAPSSDPEGSSVTYDIEVMNADDEVVATALGVTGTVTAMAEVLVDGEDYTWRARAIDAEGQESQYSEPNAFAVALPDGEVDEDPSIVVNGGGCTTGGGTGTGTGGLVLLGLGVIVGLRRRRRL